MTEQSKLEKTVESWGVWPSDESKAELKYEVCVRHMRNVIDGHRKSRWFELIGPVFMMSGISGFFGFMIGGVLERSSAYEKAMQERRLESTTAHVEKELEDRARKRRKSACAAAEALSEAGDFKFVEGRCYERDIWTDGSIHWTVLR